MSHMTAAPPQHLTAVACRPHVLEDLEIRDAVSQVRLVPSLLQTSVRIQNPFGQFDPQREACSRDAATGCPLVPFQYVSRNTLGDLALRPAAVLASRPFLNSASGKRLPARGSIEDTFHFGNEDRIGGAPGSPPAPSSNSASGNLSSPDRNGAGKREPSVEKTVTHATALVMPIG